MKGMFVDTNLSAVSTWMSYFVQIALGYLTTRGLCALIPGPRIRLRLWGCFLFLTVAGWTILGVHLSAGSSVPFTTGSFHGIGNRGQWGFWPVSGFVGWISGLGQTMDSAPLLLHSPYLHASTALEVAETQPFSTDWPSSVGGARSNLSKTLLGDEGFKVRGLVGSALLQLAQNGALRRVQAAVCANTD